MVALAAATLLGCAAPATVPPPAPTDTVVYDVPTASVSPTERVETPGATGAPLPPATEAATAHPPETRGPLPRTQLTILHTNDSRGYVDPCG